VTFQEFDVGDGQCYCLTPPQPGECECQYEVGVTARFLGQPAHIFFGEVDLAFRCLIRFLAAFEPARWVER
jgi:hypothetical protein